MTKSTLIKKIFFWSTPIILGILMMLPRLFSAQFGLLDDGLTLKMSNLMTQDPLVFLREAETGRFRPIYWLFYYFQFKNFKYDPSNYFALNLILWIASIVGIMYFIFLWTKNSHLAWFSGLLFTLSGAAIENYFTLSKPEALQIILFILILIFVLFYIRSQSKIRWAYFIFNLFLFALAIFLKETSIILVVGIAILYIGMLKQKVTYKHSLKNIIYLLIGFIFIGLVFFLVRDINISRSISDGDYTSNYQLNPLYFLASGIRWFDWLVKGYGFLIPLLLFVYFKRQSIKQSPYQNLWIGAFVWMLLWLGIYLPWIYTSEYYLLPFSLGASVFGAILIWTVYQKWKNSGRQEKIFAGVSIGLCAALGLLTVLTNISNGLVQLTADRVNGQMVAYLANEFKDSPVVYVDYPEAHEYIEEINLHLQEIWKQKSLIVKPLAELPENPSEPFYVLSNRLENSIPLSVRLGIYEAETSQREQILKETYRENLDVVTHIQQQTSLFYFDLIRVFCGKSPSLFCQSANPQVGFRSFKMSWLLYKITPP